MDTQKKRLITSRVLGSLVFILAIISVGNPNVFFDIIGFAFIVVAGVGRIWAAAYISGFKSGKVVKDGPYSMMRNPLYFFSFLGFAGVGMVFGSLILAIILIAVFMITHWPTILAEEAKLREIFGKEYDEYVNATPRFFPKTSLFQNPETIEFYPRKFTKTLFEATYLIFAYGGVKLLLWLHEAEILPNLINLY